MILYERDRLYITAGDSIVEMAHRMSVLILPARLLLSKTEWNVCKKEYMLSRLKGTERIQPETGSKV